MQPLSRAYLYGWVRGVTQCLCFMVVLGFCLSKNLVWYMSFFRFELNPEISAFVLYGSFGF